MTTTTKEGKLRILLMKSQLAAADIRTNTSSAKLRASMRAIEFLMNCCLQFLDEDCNLE